MEEDDMDFTPSPNTNSNLASLFGFNKKPLKGNPSLTYTAPKAPKVRSSPAKEEQKTNKAEIIFSKGVQVYQWKDGSYINQGLNGIVISGNHHSHNYEIILYKPNKDLISQTKISRTFSIKLSSNNYVSFYDNNKQNWSILFQSSASMEQFSQKIAICKFYTQPESCNSILTQDLTPSSESQVNSNTTVEIIYTAYSLDPEEMTKLKEGIKERIKLSSHTFTPLSNGLIGCSDNSARVVIIPNSLSGHWKSEINNKDLLLEVKVERIVSESESPVLKPPEECLESSIDSSAEETSIKARGASIKEALTKKSQKANLISRMAKMGQATLPLRQNLSGGPSDSEEEAIISSSKPRIPRSRTSANTHQNVSAPQNPEISQQLSLYHNDVALQQKVGLPYQQLIPVSASPISSPTTDPSLSVYVSESRIQAAELRMGISKISEKLDSVWNKVQNLSATENQNKSHQPPLLDSGGILASIQNLIMENENLKGKVDEQKSKIEQQNDRIFQLLELNHKYLEQSTTTHDKQSENEIKSKLEIEALRKREIEWEGEKAKALERVKSLEGELAKSSEDNMELRKKVEEMTKEMDEMKKSAEGKDDVKKRELEVLTEKMSRASEAVMKLKERLREVIAENENLKSVIKVQKEEIESGSQEVKDSKTKNREYEKTVESLKKQMSVEEEKTESAIHNLSKTVAQLEEENKSLSERLQKADNEKDIKSILEVASSVLKKQFSDGKEHAYSASVVLSQIEKVFNEAVSGSLKYEDAPVVEVEKPPVVPTPRTSLQHVEVAAKEKNESSPVVQPQEDDAKDENPPNESGKKEKTESSDPKRVQSYDQGWRTTKPPPPPLFDDEDDDDDWLN